LGRSEQTLKVTVLEIERDRVRLGFEAASNVPVNRWEVWQRIRPSAGSGDRSADNTRAAGQ
ncbi:MAG: carbon storage regulator, partial [Tepidisphaeraceae bacterium]